MPYDPVLHIVLHQPEIHYNTGNIGRTCVAVGAKLWLVKPIGFNIDEASVRRAGLDYWEMLDLAVVDDWQALAEHLPADNHWYFTKKARRTYTDVTYSRGDVLVFGSESRGLPDDLLASHQRCLRIPTRAEVRCLNLSNAVAVACYEAQRQWQD